MNKKLIFVYNADSGLLNGAMDAMHKTFSPSTYKCDLCKMTYGALSAKKSWTQFIEQLPIECEFLHKDEFHKKYTNDAPLPALFLKENNDLTVLISSSAMENMNLKTFKDQIMSKVQNKTNKAIYSK